MTPVQSTPQGRWVRRLAPLLVRGYFELLVPKDAAAAKRQWQGVRDAASRYGARVGRVYSVRRAVDAKARETIICWRVK